MNKIKIDGVLIVEGKADVSYLSSFVDAYFFTTNGYDLDTSKIAFLKEASKVNKLIIFTDSDDAGEVIRNRLKNEINPIFEAKTSGKSRKNYKKCGVAEQSKESVIEALKNYMTEKEINRYNYRLVGLVSLSSNPANQKEKLVNKYRLIDGNIKSLENQLNILKILPKEVEELLSGN